MAVGYSHVATVGALLGAGADPEIQDRQSRDVVALVDSIRDKMPVAPQFMGRRMALEQVTALLSGARARLEQRSGAVVLPICYLGSLLGAGRCSCDVAPLLRPASPMAVLVV